MEESVRIPGIGRIRENTEKLSRRVSKKCRIRVSPEKWKNPCEYRGIGRIRESTKKLVGRVPENGRIRVSTGK